MNLFQVGYYGEFEPTEPTTALIVIAETQTQALGFWTESTIGPRLGVANLGILANDALLDIGVVGAIGNWESYSLPGVTVDTSTYGRHSWQLEGGEVFTYNGFQAQSLSPYYNQALSLEKAYALLQISFANQHIDAELSSVEHVYLSNHKTQDGEVSYWLTVTAKGVTGVCRAAGPDMDKSDVRLMYVKLLHWALEDIIAKLKGTYVAEKPNVESVDKIAALIASYFPTKSLPESTFPSDGTDIPINDIATWMRSTEDERHIANANLLADCFESVQFLLFPNGKSFAATGLLRKERINVHVCFSAPEGLNLTAKALYLLLREKARAEKQVDFTFRTPSDVK